ncbi:MAG: TonB-dependent receptor [Melioribacteraceae bacterium]|nr:TonB-dependent receptor [Melioribacteraceae bacterium]
MKSGKLLKLFFFLLLSFQQASPFPKPTEHPLSNNNSPSKYDESTGGLKGIVLDENGKVLFSANIIILGTNFGLATSFEGKFRIDNIPVGKYKIQVSYVGYTKKIIDVEIVEKRFIQLDVRLKPESFSVGGITVTAKEDLLPRDIATKTNISSGEIEHYQATNLGDVLDLVPGIQKDANPGMDKTSQVAIRASASNDEQGKIEAFGTKIIVDGEPLSNNSNLQFETMTGSKFGFGNMGGGVDLREIPADNLESVSVISGIPSVRYGDFSNGIIELKTKMGVAPHRVKVKNNPHTTEANFGGGFNLGTSSLNYNANVARSERDLRLVGDEYTRITAQLIYGTVHSNNWTARYKLKGQAIYDEKEPIGDMLKTKDYNRGYTVGLNTWGSVKPFNQVSKLKYSAYVSMKNINSMRSKLITDYLVVNEDTLASYLGKVETKGVQWLAGGRVEWQNVFYTGDYIHNFLIGTEVQYDANTGEGVVFDTVYSYYGVESQRRPYKFDSIPGQLILSMYAEDKLTGHFLFDFSLMFGFRYEMYRPHSFNLSGLWGDGDIVNSHQGSFFNPRISLLTYFSSQNQLRINFGSSSKSPALSLIYPREEVFTWRNLVTGINEYYRYDKRVPDLQGYKTTQLEISYDHKFLNKMGISLTGYYRERNNQPKYQDQPVFTEIEDNGQKVVYYIGEYKLSYNIGTNISKGIEFTYRTAQIKPLNMNFKISASYSYNKTPSNGFSYQYAADESIGQFENYQVPNVEAETLIGLYYPSKGRWSDRLQINYYVKYIHEELGLWVTLRAEQLYSERYQNFSLIPKDYNLLTDEGKIDRNYEESVISKSPKWLFSFNVSKSLFPGAEVSFYVNNFMDNPAIWRFYNPIKKVYEERIRNPKLFYGIEFSMIFDELFK